MDIQWYPGHMVKTKNVIRENMKLVDIVLELTDARAPLSTHIPDINNLTGNRDIVMVLNKADLADKKITDLWIKYFKKQGVRVIAVDTLRKSGFKKLYNLIRSANKKTMISPIRCMVIGVPNVGKSSLINQMAGRKSVRTADTPGITRSKMWLKVDSILELLDTPGILWPKFEDRAVGIKLAILGSIKPELLNFEQLSVALLKYLSVKYPHSLKARYNVDPDMSPMGILEKIAQHRGFLAAGGNLNIDRSAKTLIHEFRQGVLGGVSLEKPEEKGGFWDKISNQDIV
ncbi:MAG TPA: ribosome biogenesis GTPase YlqF [Thermoanaerobacterales bacterium]|nr:ribosome biogenesis GTPase YlqF [Thermoanaerobacterales bacterium]